MAHFSKVKLGIPLDQFPGLIETGMRTRIQQQLSMIDLHIYNTINLFLHSLAESQERGLSSETFSV